MKVTTPDGRTVDSIAVAADDMILTAFARCDLADDASREWLADRMRAHAADVDTEIEADVFRALARYCDACGAK